MFLVLNPHNFHLWIVYKSDVRISCFRSNREMNRIKPFKARLYLPHYWSEKGFKGNIVHQTLTF